MKTADPQASRNVDEAELAKFAEAAHRWWDTDSEFRPLHEINPLRLGWVAQHAPLNAQAEVLDVGCGGGILTEALARKARHATGIDLAAASLQVARLHALEGGLANIRYEEVAVEDWAERHPAHYDIVTCMEMLEHVPDPASVVRACSRLVKPGGWVFFSTLNRNARAFVQAIIGAEYVLGLLTKGTHEYARFIRPSELARWAREAGLEVGPMAGIGYNPLTRRYALTEDTRVNYLMAARRP